MALSVTVQSCHIYTTCIPYIPHTNPAVEHQLVVINNVRNELQPHELKCPKLCVLDIRTPSLILLLGGVEG